MRYMKSLILAACSMVAVGTASAADKDLVDYRQANMQIIGAHMKSIGAIVKNEVPYGDHLAAHAQGMAAAAAQVKVVFEPKVTADKTTAKPEIWDRWNDFAKSADDFQQAATKFAEAAVSGNQGAIRAALGPLGKSCKSCHDNFKAKN